MLQLDPLKEISVVDDTELFTYFFIVYQHKLKVGDANIVQLSTVM